MRRLEPFLIKNKVLEVSTDGNLLFTEDFLRLLMDRLDKSDCVINYIPNYRMSGKKVSLPILSNMKLELKDDKSIVNRQPDGVSIEVKISEAQLIQLDLAFSSSIFDLQGTSLQHYLLDELEETMIQAIHFRLVETLKELNLTETTSKFTDKWFKTFCASLKGNSLLLIKSDMVGRIQDLEYSHGELMLFGQRVLVTDDPNFEGIVVIGCKAVTFVQSGEPELYIDEETGYRSNLIYLGNRFYCNFLIKRPEHCCHIKFE